MGVFARLLRKSKATEEASTAEVQAGTQSADTEAEVTEAAKGSSEASQASESTETPGSSEPSGSGCGAATAAAEVTGAATTEDVEIPQQQTAAKAADNEAGEGART